MQNYDGGFAFWDRGHPSEPYLTVLRHERARAREGEGLRGAGSRCSTQAQAYLQNIETHYPVRTTREDVRCAISAYALYTRKQLGDLDSRRARGCCARRAASTRSTMETDGWLLGAVRRRTEGAPSERKAIVRYAMNHVSETAGAANFTTQLRRRRTTCCSRAIAASTA